MSCKLQSILNKLFDFSYVHDSSFSSEISSMKMEGEILACKERKRLEMKMHNLFKTVIYHVVFMLALFIVLTGNQDEWSYRQNDALREQYVQSEKTMFTKVSNRLFCF